MVTAPNDDWTEELCKKLIHEYRKRPILWDTKDPFFFKKTMKPAAWEAIATALNMPPELCKHKMVILQSSFRREKSKIMQSIRDSPDEAKFTSTWFAFEDMAFLIDKKTERKRQLTASNGVTEYINEDGSTAIKRSLLDLYNEKKAESKKKSSNNSKIGTVLPNMCKSPSPGGRAATASAQLPTLVTTFRDPTPAVPTPVEKSRVTSPPPAVPPLVPARPREDTLEEIKSFTNFIAYKMNKYSETTKNSVQQAICDIIFKADQNFYETVTFGDNFNNYQNFNHVVLEDCDSQDKTIDIGNGQIIKLQMHDSD